MCGDLYFRLINSKNGKLICRFAMNTSFCDETNIYTFDKAGVDPDSIIKNKDFDSKFAIELHFQDVCKNCSSRNELQNLCNDCKINMQTEFLEWQTIKKIVDRQWEELDIMKQSIMSKHKYDEETKTNKSKSG